MEFKSKTDHREKEYRKTNTNYIDARQEFKLSLRKQSVHKYLNTIRERSFRPNSYLVIKKERLDLSGDILAYENDDFFEYTSFLLSKDINAIKYAICQVKDKSFSFEDDINFATELVSKGMLQLLHSVLSKHLDYDDIVYEILQIYINFGLYIDITHRKFFLEKEIMNDFFTILKLNKPFLTVQVIQTMIRAIVHNESGKLPFIRSNVFYLLINKILIVEGVSSLVLKEGVWLLSTLSENPNIFSEEQLLKIGEILLKNLLSETCGNNDCLKALGQIAAVDNKRLLKFLLNNGVIDSLYRIDTLSNNKLNEYRLSILGNLLSHDEGTVGYIVSTGVIEFIDPYVLSDVFTVRRTAIWALSNLVGTDDKSFVELVLEKGIVDKIYDQVRDHNKDIVYESLFFIFNCINRSDMSIVKKFIEKGLINLLVFSLKTNNLYKMQLLKTVHIIYEILVLGEQEQENDQNIVSINFAQAGGVDLVEALQNTDDNNIFKFVLGIISEFYETEVA